ncbi:MAG: adenylate/guanylate cyclase domain-containing protein [Methyloceanibacter sp.]|uniref:adenylate/guanylate cyclase domain-containing protein n=1 Tax=Methyloceanibacter sp. TaxID=1965321 RepID=UPI003D6CCF86
MTIRFFSKSDRYREFSNFANYPILIDGTVWPTSEHYYQAQKFDEPDRQERIRQLPNAAAAKRYASKYKGHIRPDWDAMKDAIMERALRAKFTQHETLRDLLVGSGEEKIEEDSPKDRYWGTGPDGAGQNKLGQMLMRLRAELRHSAAPRHAARFGWLAPLIRLAEIGTANYPRPVRRQLTIVNVMAFLIVIFSVVYAGVFAYYGVDKYWPLIVANLLLVLVALAAPLAHRINDIAAALLICVAEYLALFFFVRELGRDSGIQINYIIVAAVAFAICGMGRLRLVAAVIAIGLALHLAAWFLYPPESAQIAADPGLLANLYVSSAVTTFGIIALLVGYAFTVADRARAEADSLLANILPEAIAERLKEKPGERVADSVDEASVLFTDLVGFTELAQKLGVARTVAILDQIVTEFDRLAAAHGVEKIKTIGDGYMAVAGVSRPLHDHLPRLARMALQLPDLVARLSEIHGVDLKIRIGIAGGPVMAGIIGTDKFSYDVWGETVNLASRLESHGIPGEIQVSGAVMERLGDAFVFEPRGPIQVKGVGQLETWLLKAERSASAGDAPS